MELNQCIPYIRFADTLRFEFQRGPSRTCDCRLLYGISGTAEVDIVSKTLVLTCGSILIFQPNTEYRIRPNPAITLAVMDFDFTQEHRLHTELLRPCPSASFDSSRAHRHICFSDAPVFDSPVYLKNAAFLEGIVQNILREFQQKRLFFQGKASTLFKSLLFEIARAEQTGLGFQDTVPLVLEYIEKNIGHKISNLEIGEALNYNPNYLNRLMLQHTGMSLHRYIMQRRLSLAITLLLTTNQPAASIAADLGFNSSSHFSNFFKKETGMTPNSYRQQGTL